MGAVLFELQRIYVVAVPPLTTRTNWQQGRLANIKQINIYPVRRPLPLSPSWTLCRGHTLGVRAGIPDSCSRSGPPALRSTSSRSRPRPPGGAAALPPTPPSWSTRCRTHAALSGTLMGKGKIVNYTWERVVDKRWAAEWNMHSFFYSLCQLIDLHYLQLSEFPSYLLQYGNRDLSFTLHILRPHTATHLNLPTDGNDEHFTRQMSGIYRITCHAWVRPALINHAATRPKGLSNQTLQQWINTADKCTQTSVSHPAKDWTIWHMLTTV